MRWIVFLFGSLFVASCSTTSSHPEETAKPADPNALSTQLQQQDDRKTLSEYGINGQCINMNKVRSYSVIDSKTLIFKLRNGKEVLGKLRSSCDSLQFGLYAEGRGFGSQICARVDRIYGRDLNPTQLNVGCVIDEFQPIIELERAPENDVEPGDNQSNEG